MLVSFSFLQKPNPWEAKEGRDKRLCGLKEAQDLENQPRGEQCSVKQSMPSCVGQRSKARTWYQRVYRMEDCITAPDSSSLTPCPPALNFPLPPHKGRELRLCSRNPADARGVRAQGADLDPSCRVDPHPAECSLQ